MKCQFGCPNEATHQMPNETAYYCCYECWILCIDVT